MIVWRNNILNRYLSICSLSCCSLLPSTCEFRIIISDSPDANNNMTMQDVDGRHLLFGAPETASPSAQRDRCHLICILPLQSHHGEAADAAECGPGRRGRWSWRRLILICSLDSSLTSPWPISLSTTPEWPSLSPPTECPLLESSSEPSPRGYS